MENKKIEPDDKSPWRAFVQGDEKTFEKVFNAHFKSMYGYGMKLCNRPALVKDCIQELWMNIWERRAELCHIHSPKVYLFVSLRRKVLKELTHLRKLDGLDDHIEGMDEGIPIQFSKEEIIIKDEIKFQTKEHLQQALNQLSGRQKEIIYLHYYNGMSYGEIEEILSINRQSVRNHMYRAMETLRSVMNTEIMKLVIALLLFFLFLV